MIRAPTYGLVADLSSGHRSVDVSPLGECIKRRWIIYYVAVHHMMTYQCHKICETKSALQVKRRGYKARDAEKSITLVGSDSHLQT
jgi:hypothetical protein